MISTAKFLEASPEQKEAMIKDGLAFVTSQMEMLERNARVLTGWMATYPDNVKLDYAKLERPIEAVQSIIMFTRTMDDLTAQLVNASIAGESLLQYSRKRLTDKQLQP